MIGGGVFNKQVTGCRISVEFRLKKKCFKIYKIFYFAADQLFCSSFKTAKNNRRLNSTQLERLMNASKEGDFETLVLN